MWQDNFFFILPPNVCAQLKDFVERNSAEWKSELRNNCVAGLKTFMSCYKTLKLDGGAFLTWFLHSTQISGNC